MIWRTLGSDCKRSDEGPSIEDPRRDLLRSDSADDIDDGDISNRLDADSPASSRQYMTRDDPVPDPRWNAFGNVRNLTTHHRWQVQYSRLLIVSGSAYERGPKFIKGSSCIPGFLSRRTAPPKFLYPPSHAPGLVLLLSILPHHAPYHVLQSRSHLPGHRRLIC